MSGRTSSSSPRTPPLAEVREGPSRRAQELLRRRYRPNDVRVLFVGESPPASGRFFYQQDSGLYRAVFETFRRVDSSLDHANFLTLFARARCYLVDLCPEPVDRLAPAPRRAACRAGEASLARAISRLRPTTIVSVVRSIEDNVDRAASRAGWRGEVLRLPYPGRWQRSRAAFCDALVPTVRTLLRPTMRSGSQ